LKVFAAIPSLGEISCGLARNCILWKIQMQKSLVFHSVDGYRPISVAQNRAVENFLKTDCDRILFLEADVIPPPNDVCNLTLMELLKFDVDIIGGLTFITQKGKIFRGKAIAASKMENGEAISLRPQELKSMVPIEVDFIGTSSLFVKREVFEILSPPWFKFVYHESGEVEMTQDYFFSQKAKDADFKIFLHPLMGCIHQVEVGI